jgi:hypothetical protein
MPIVPRYQQGQVTPNTIPNVQISDSNVSANTFGAGAFGALAGIGNTISAIAEREQKKTDVTYQMQAENELAELENTMFNAPETGAFNKKGKDAIDASQAIWPEWDKRSSEILSKVPERIQLQVKQQIEKRKQGAQTNWMRHVSRESDNLMGMQATGMISAAANSAGLNYLDPSRIDSEATNAMFAADKLMDLKGADDITRANARRDAASGIYMTALNRRLADDPVQAESYYLSVKDRMSAEDQAKFEAVSKPVLEDYGDQNEYQSLLQGVIPSAPTGGYKDKRRAIESGGKNDAYNSASGALGPDQFVKDTWLGLVKNNKPAWAEGLSEKEILAKRTDPSISGEMADLLDKENTQALRARGVQVNDTALYAAHHFGAAPAAKFMKADDNTPMSQIVGRAAMQDNPYFSNNGKPRTKAEILSIWRSRGMADGEVASERVAPPQTLDDVLAITQNIPDIKKRERIERLAKNDFAQRAAQKKQYQDALSDEIYSTIVSADPTLPLSKVLPPDRLAFLAQDAGLSASVERYKKLTAGGGLIENDPVLLDNIKRMQAFEPDKFKKLNLAQYLDKLDGKTLLSLKNDQKSDSAEKRVQWAADATLLDKAYRDLGLEGKGNEKKRNQFLDTFQRSKQIFVEKNKREPDSNEVLTMINSLKLPVALGNRDGKVVPRFQAGGEIDIPEAELQKAALELAKIWPTNRAITQTNVRDYYLRKQRATYE